MTFHPLATQAILELAYFPINQARVGSLKHPLARWLTTRMSHNYRQARKKGFVQKDGYQMSLKTILEERGLVPEARLRNNLRRGAKCLEGDETTRRSLQTAGFRRKARIRSDQRTP